MSRMKRIIRKALAVGAIVLGVGYFAYLLAKPAPGLVFTAEDLQPGAKDRHGETQALLAACRRSSLVPPEKRDAGCVCMSQRAQRELSRPDRLMLTGQIGEDYELIKSVSISYMQLAMSLGPNGAKEMEQSPFRYLTLIEDCLK
jgi:hypothetical protein